MSEERKIYTYLYTDKPKHEHFAHMPELNGMKCVGIAVGDYFRKADRAMGFIARMADGEFSDPEEAAYEFFKGTGFEKTYQCLKSEYNKEPSA